MTSGSKTESTGCGNAKGAGFVKGALISWISRQETRKSTGAQPYSISECLNKGQSRSGIGLWTSCLAGATILLNLVVYRPWRADGTSIQQGPARHHRNA